MSVSWSGRGADEGKDFIFTEIMRGAISNTHIRWLVQCKDFCKSGKSVNEYDVGSITDKIEQHDVDGYLLATSTYVSSGLVKKLNSLDITKGGKYNIKIWDYPEITALLIQDENKDILKEYLPQSYKRLFKYDSIEGVIDILKEKISEQDFEKIYRIINKDEIKVSGKEIWSFSDSANKIDEINKYLSSGDFEKAAYYTPGIEYEAFMLYIERLHEYDSSLTYNYLLALIRELTEQDIIFNCVQYLFDNFEVRPDVYIEVLSYLDDEGKSLLLDNEIIFFIHKELTDNISKYSYLYSDIGYSSFHPEFQEVIVEYVDYDANSKDKIKFRGKLKLELKLYSDTNKDSKSFYRLFECNYKGFMDANAIYLQDVKVDKSEYGKDSKQDY